MVWEICNTEHQSMAEIFQCKGQSNWFGSRNFLSNQNQAHSACGIPSNQGLNHREETVSFQWREGKLTCLISEYNKTTQNQLFQDIDSMFNMYTKEGCLYECRLMNAFHISGCIPWDYPIPPTLEGESTTIKMCDSMRKENESTSESDLAKFYDFMNNEESTRNCNCKPNCEEVVFETQVGLFSFLLWSTVLC